MSCRIGILGSLAPAARALEITEGTALAAATYPSGKRRSVRVACDGRSEANARIVLLHRTARKPRCIGCFSLRRYLSHEMVVWARRRSSEPRVPGEGQESGSTFHPIYSDEDRHTSLFSSSATRRPAPQPSPATSPILEKSEACASEFPSRVVEWAQVNSFFNHRSLPGARYPVRLSNWRRTQAIAMQYRLK